MPCCDVMLTIRPRASPRSGWVSMRCIAARQSIKGPRRFTAMIASKSLSRVWSSGLGGSPASAALLTRAVGLAVVRTGLGSQTPRVAGAAPGPGLSSPLVDGFRARGGRIEQLPSPDVAFAGLTGSGEVGEQYDTPASHRHCQRLAVAVAD